MMRFRNMKTLGEHILNKVYTMGLSKAEFGRQIGMSRQQINQFSNRKSFDMKLMDSINDFFTYDIREEWLVETGRKKNGLPVSKIEGEKGKNEYSPKTKVVLSIEIIDDTESSSINEELQAKLDQLAEIINTMNKRE